MKLHYRGVNYEYNPSIVETFSETVAGKYRGLNWRFRHLKKSQKMPSTNLTYRGVAY
jgi:hypothetical protein